MGILSIISRAPDLVNTLNQIASGTAGTLDSLATFEDKLLAENNGDVIPATTNATLQVALIKAFAQMDKGTTSPVTAGGLALTAAGSQLGVLISDTKDTNVPVSTVIADGFTFLSDITLIYAAAAFGAGDKTDALRLELLAGAEGSDAVFINNHAYLARAIDANLPGIGDTLFKAYTNITASLDSIYDDYKKFLTAPPAPTPPPAPAPGTLILTINSPSQPIPANTNVTYTGDGYAVTFNSGGQAGSFVNTPPSAINGSVSFYVPSYTAVTLSPEIVADEAAQGISNYSPGLVQLQPLTLPDGSTLQTFTYQLSDNHDFNNNPIPGNSTVTITLPPAAADTAPPTVLAGAGVITINNAYYPPTATPTPTPEPPASPDLVTITGTDNVGNYTYNFTPNTTINFNDGVYSFTVNTGPDDATLSYDVTATDKYIVLQLDAFQSISVPASDGLGARVLTVGVPQLNLSGGTSTFELGGAHDTKGTAVSDTSTLTVTAPPNGLYDVWVPSVGASELDIDENARGSIVPTPTPVPTPAPAPVPTPTPAPTPTPTPTATDFNGDQVSLNIYEPNIGSLIGSLPATTVVAGTTTFPGIGGSAVNGATVANADIDLSGSQMTFLYAASDEGLRFPSATFNGYEFKTAASDPAMTGVSLVSTNIAGLTASDFGISNSGHTFDLNVQGLTLPTGVQGSIVLGFDFAGQSAGFATALVAHPSA